MFFEYEVFIIMGMNIRPVLAASLNAVFAALRRRGAMPGITRQVSSSLNADTFARTHGTQGAQTAVIQGAATAARHELLFRRYGGTIDMLDPLYANRPGIQNAAIAHLTRDADDVQGLIEALQAKDSLNEAEQAALQALQRHQNPPQPPLPRPVQPSISVAIPAV